MLYSFLDARGGHRMALGHVGANTENDIGFVHIGEGIGHSSAADGSRQTGDCGRVSSTAAVVNLIGPEAGAYEFLHCVGCLVWCPPGSHTTNCMSPMFFENFIAPERVRDSRAGLMAGTWGHEFFAGLDIGSEELVVDKDRFSAFSPGASTLDKTLKTHGVDTVFVAGTMTNVCCDSTARDAMMLDYRAVMVEDANAARSDEAHVGALSTFMSVFGDVLTTREVIGALQAK